MDVMKTNEEAAREYADKVYYSLTDDQSSDFSHDLIERSFLSGVEHANEWREIDRDDDGFATSKCLDDIFQQEQALLLMHDGSIDAISKDHDKSAWRGDIQSDISYVSWRPI